MLYIKNYLRMQKCSLFLVLFLFGCFTTSCNSDTKTKDIKEKEKIVFSVFDKEQFFKDLDVPIYSNMIDKSDLVSKFVEKAANETDKGNFGRAINYYQRAIEAQPQNAMLYVMCGNMYYAAGNRNAALTHYDKALSLDPNFISGYFQRAGWFYYAGLYENALADYKKMVEIKPSLAFAYLTIGYLSEKAGRKNEAIEAYKTFLTISSSNKKMVQQVEFAQQQINHLQDRQ